MDEPIVNYNQRYQNLVERVEGCQLNSITSMVTMELYLGSIIECIRKSIWNTLYFNSKHVPKTLDEAMQKAQDLHIKHLYALGEDQQDSSVTSSDNILPEITVNEMNTCNNRGWYRHRRLECEDSDYLQNSHEIPKQTDNYTKKVTFDWPNGTNTVSNSKHSDYLPDLQVLSQTSSETEKDKSSQQQQPSVICGSFTQIMNPIQLQEHKFTAWLDRLVEASRNRQDKQQHPYRMYRKPYNEGKQPGDKWMKPPLHNKIKPAQGLEVQQIMGNFNYEYDDVVEAMDLYNLDVEECTTAHLHDPYQHRYDPENYFVSNEPAKEICIVDKFQRRGTTFPLNVDAKDRKPQFFCFDGYGCDLQLHQLQHILQVKHATITTRSSKSNRSRWR